jgi:hypothetical protein
MTLLRQYFILLVLLILIPKRGISQVRGIDLLGSEDELVLPFSFENGFILVDLFYNNFIPLKFILDTGAEHTILFDRQINDIFAIPYDQRVQIIGSDLSDVIYASIARNVPIRLGSDINVERDIIILEEDKMRLDEITGIPIDGIIGASFFKNLIVRFDFPKKKIHFYHPDNFDFSTLKDFDKSSVTIKSLKPYIRLPTYILRDDKTELQELKFLVDTGASLPILVHYQEEGKLALPEKLITGNLALGLGGNLKGHVGRISSLSVGNHSFKNVISYFQSIGIDTSLVDYSLHRDGLLGTGILSRFDMYLDYLNKELYLKPNKNFKKEFKYDRSGLVLLAFGSDLNKFYVRTVISDSPASKAGFKEGDVITRIGLWKSKFFSLERITRKLSGRQGKKIRLTIMRNDQKLKKSIRLKDLI